MAIDHYSSAGAMLAALRARELSAAELAELHIERIEVRDEALNAIPIRTFDRAREQAAAADARLAAGDSAPLLGLPMTLKESTQTAGLPQSAGIADLKDYRPGTDGLLATAVFDAGAGLLGKTNIPVALGDWQADSPVYGRTNNPWDPARSPGGSSGGEGAIVGAGASPLGLGTDIGGSIRVPSHACGVHGLKPTTGRLTKIGTYDAELFPGQRAVIGMPGPIARRVEDLTLAMEILLGGGPEMALPTYPLVPLGDPRAEPSEGLRVPWIDDDGCIRPAPAIRRAVREPVAALEARGAIGE
jgi:Asp-tRNA(Asn)/Glu-tRNA(Gln) amidotransferase A subunit family amidase